MKTQPIQQSFVAKTLRRAIALACAPLLLLSAQAGSVITNVVETNGDNEATDTIAAKWTGEIVNNGINGEFPSTNTYLVPTFAHGVFAHVDRTHSWKIATNGLGEGVLPPYLIGGDYIMIGNDNRDNTNLVLDISLATPAYVYILVENRTGDPSSPTTPNDPPIFGPNAMSWMLTDGWVAMTNGLNRFANSAVPDEVGNDNNNDGTINDFASVYRRHVPAGTVQTFGAYNGGRGMYGLVAVAAVPPAPLTLAAAKRDGAVQVNFSAVGGATSYNVKRGLAPAGPFTTITNTTATALLDAGLVNGTTYYYVVSAVGSVGEGPDSLQASATPNAAVTSLTAVWTNGTIELAWPEVASALNYNVYRGYTAGGPYVALTTTNATTNFVDLTFTNGVTYYYIVSANFASGEGVNSPEASAQTPPAIVVQPATTSVPDGGTIALSVTAVGTGTLTYQWTQDGTNVTGANSASLTINNATTNNAGAYTVVIANGIGSVTSQVATVSVLLTPFITLDLPPQVFMKSGDVGAFGVVVRGQEPLSFFWQKFNGTDWLAAVSDDLGQPASFTQLSWDAAETGDYRVVITNVLGAATSSVASVTVVLPINLTTVPPASQMVTSPAPVTFTVEATGNLLNYQWFKDDVAIVDATNNIYAIAATAPGSQGNYTVQVTNQFFAVTSAPSFLDIQFAPVISSQPANRSVNYGASAVFSVTATADPSPTYQWQVNGVDIVDATNSSYTVSSAQAGDVGAYRVVVSNPIGTVTSATARLWATPAADYFFPFNTTADLLNFNISAAATPASIAHSTSGGIPVGTANAGSIDWINNNDANANLAAALDFSKPGTIVGISAMLKQKRPTSVQRYLQIGLVNDTTSRFNDTANMIWGSVRFNAPTANNDDSQFRYQDKPTSTTGLKDGPLALGLNNINTTIRTLQGHWYKVTGFFQNIGNGQYRVWGSVTYYGNNPYTTIAGTIIHQLPPITIYNPALCSDTTVYVGFRGGDNSGSDRLDDFAVYRSAVLPVIGLAPDGQTVSPGGAATFRVGVDAMGHVPAFQWYANGVAIPNATNIFYKTPYVTAAADGTLYHVVVTTPVGSVTSAAARLTVAGTDTTAPLVVSAGSIDPRVVGVAFSETMDAATANNPANYTVNGAAPVKATLQDDGLSVRLDLAAPISGSFNVTANNLADVSGNPLGSATTNGTLWAQEYLGLDMGYPLVAGRSDYSAGPGWIDLSAGGADLWGNNDSGYFFLTPMAGDFDLKVRATSLVRVPGETIFGDTAGRTEGVKMGLVIRDSLAFGARDVLLSTFPVNNDGQYFPGNNVFEVKWRQPLSTSGSGTLTASAGVNRTPFYPNAWMRLRRVGDTITTYISTNGIDWLQYTPSVAQTNLPDTVYVGLAGSARANVSGFDYKGIGYFRDYGLFVNPAAVVSTPTISGATTVAEGANLELTADATVTGVATNELQFNWQRSADGGATWRTVTGLFSTNATMTNFAVKAWQENGAQYRVSASAGGVSAVSAPVTITVTDGADMTFVSAVAELGQYNGVVLTFSEAPSLASATNLSNYLVTESDTTFVPVASVQVLPNDPTKVVLTFNQSLGAGLSYSVALQNLQDRAGRDLAGNNVLTFALANLATTPTVIEKYNFFVGMGSRAGDLMDDARFAAAQYSELFVTNLFGFNPWVTNAAPFTNQVDNYVIRSRVYFVPPANGNYRFFLRSDDSARLFMNTNAVGSENAEAVSLIAWNAGSSSTYGLDGFRVSAYVPLIANQKYYMEAWMAEGTGNDGWAVMWRDSANTSTPGNAENIDVANLAPVIGPVTVASVTPANPTVTDAYGPITLKAVGVHGAGPYYVQWYKNGQPIPGAQRYTYTVPAPTVADSGAVYSFRIANNFSYAEASTTITVQADAAPLQIVAVTPSRWMDAVSVTFNKTIAPAAAYNPANYSVGQGLVITSIGELSADGRTVTLRTTEHQEAMVYDLTAQGIATNFQAYLTVRGYLTANLFFEIDGGTVGALLTHPKYINNLPDTNWVVQGGNYAPAGLDRYGGRMNGWFVPPVSGNYVFYTTADDGNHLYLNTNSTGSFLAEGKTLVAKSDFANRAYDDMTAGTPRYSGRIPMVAGQKYYIEELWKEGTGGDYGRIAVRGPYDFAHPLFIAEYAAGALFAYPVHPSQLTPVYMLQAPANASIAVGTNAVLTAVAAGLDGRAPVTYMWQKSDGVGGYTNIVDAYSGSYTTAVFYAAETATYRVMAYSPSGLTNAVVTVTATGTYTDTNAPALFISAPQTNGTVIKLAFTEPMNAATATQPGNYRITDFFGTPIPVSSVVQYPDGTNITLFTAPMVAGSMYNMAITNLSDLAGNPLPDTLYSFYVPQGVYSRKRYNGTIASVAALVATTKYINDLWDDYTFPSIMDLGSIADNYGLKLTGFIVPDRTGNHTFYLASDDQSEFRLSTDANPANMRLVANEQGHAGGQRNWTGAGSGRTINPATGLRYNTTSNIWLQMGKPYYFEILHREGSGGDYCGLAWQPPGTPTPINGNATFAINSPNLSLPFADTSADVVNPVPAITTNEFARVTLAPTYTGLPMSFQWLSNGVPVAGAVNGTYTTPSLLYPANNGVQYSVMIWSSRSGYVTSAPTVITLEADLVAPTVATADGGYRGTPEFRVSFNEPVTAATATNLANYTVTGSEGALTIAAATLQSNGQDVTLRLASPPVEGTVYTITVSNVTDRANAANVVAGASRDVTAWRFSASYAYYEVYTNLTGSTLPDLTNSAAYLANQPSFTGYTNRAGYGNSLTVQPYENYGFVMRSYFLAPAFDDYVFFLSHDDAAMLRLSLDGSAANVPAVINQAAVQNGFAHGAHSYTNAGMFTGPRYFFEVLGKEGTGGDYFRVGATTAVAAADPLALAALQPVPASQLGVYAPPATLTITQQPTNTTIVQNRTATFAVAADVLPAGVAPYAAYQWRSNGVDIPGANGRTYTTAVQPSVGAADTYSVVVSAPGAVSVVSDGALLTVEADTAAPNFVFAGSVDGRTIEVQYDELVDPVTAQDATLYYINYTSDPDPFNFNNWLNDFNSAVLRPDGRTVSLTLAQPLNQRTFMVQANFVKDLTLDENNGTLSEVIAGVNLGLTSEDMGLLTGQMVGASSNYLTAPNGITVKSDGADIWGASDGGNFLYREVAGNFDINVQIASLWRADFWSKAGLMARTSATNNSFNFVMFSTPNPTDTLTAQNTYSAQWRDPSYPSSRSSGDEGLVRPTIQPYPDNWVRLKRVGNEMMAAYSTNGVDWIWHFTNRTVAAQSATGKLLVGLATTSHTTATQTVADYRNLYFPVPPTITVQPSPVSISAGVHATATLSGEATNPANSGVMVYQWRKNNQALPGETNATLTFANLASTDTGIYILAAGNDGGESWSVPVMLTVTNQVPVLGADLIASAQGTVVTFPVSNLLTNDVDPDGDALTLVGLFRQPRTLFYDFNNGLPTNTLIFGNAMVDVSGGTAGSGVLKLTAAAGSLNGMFILDDPVLTNLVINEFTLDCKLFIGSGSATPADGMGFFFGPDLPNGTLVNPEDKFGAGLSINIDNYNSGNNEAPAIDISYGSTYAVRIPIPTIRQTDYVDFHVRLDLDGTLDVVYAGSIIVSNLPMPYVPAKGRFAIAARTGGSYEAHWVDDLRLTVDSVNTPLGGTLTVSEGIITYTPAAGACGADTFSYAMTDGQADGLVVAPVTISMPETNSVPPSFVVGLTNQTLPADATYQAALPDLRGQVLATDNCSILTLAQTPAVGALLPLGDTTVTIIATDGLGLTATNEAVVTVVPTTAPTITAQPTNVAVSLGGTATFSVTANGGLPVTYQWLLNGTNLDGATSATLVITNAQVANAGTYSVAVSNSFDGLISDAVVLTVITTPPTVGSPLFGAGAFSVKVDSIIGRTYVLQHTDEFKLNPAETVWTDLPGVAGTGGEITLTDPAATAPRRYYRIAVQ